MKVDNNSIRPNHYKRRVLLIAAFLAISIPLGLFIFNKMYTTNFIKIQTSDNDNANLTGVNNNPPTQEQIDAGIKHPDIQTDNDLGISISTINKTDTQVKIRSNISGVITNNGLCILTLTNNDVELIKTVKTYAMPNYSTCKGFDIDKSELSIGIWQVNLSVSVDDKQSNITDSFSLE